MAALYKNEACMLFSWAAHVSNCQIDMMLSDLSYGKIAKFY